MAATLEDTEPASRARLLRLAGVVSLVAAILLLVLKLAAWWASGAVSILALAADALKDLASSGFTLLAAFYATRPADRNHRYGHGKAEPLAAYTQALVLAASALGIAGYALWRGFTGAAPDAAGGPMATLFMLAAIVVTVALVLFQRTVIARTGSSLIAADTLHYRSDVLLAAGGIGVLLAGPRWPLLDSLLALLIAAYMLFSAAGIARQAVHQLLDRALPREVHRELRDMAATQAPIRGVNDIRTRHAGGRYFIDMELVFEPGVSLEEAHSAGESFERSILRRYPDALVTLHFDVDFGTN